MIKYFSVFQVLASYINPAGSTSNGETQSSHEGRGQNSSALPSVLLELLSQSCLIPAMSSYLRNDSGNMPFSPSTSKISYVCQVSVIRKQCSLYEQQVALAGFSMFDILELY